MHCAYNCAYIHTYINVQISVCTTEASAPGDNEVGLCAHRTPRIDSCIWLVGSFKLKVSFAEYHLFYRALLQKIPIILRSLLIVATLAPRIHTCIWSCIAYMHIYIQLYCMCTHTCTDRRVVRTHVCTDLERRHVRTDLPRRGRSVHTPSDLQIMYCTCRKICTRVYIPACLVTTELRRGDDGAALCIMCIYQTASCSMDIYDYGVATISRLL